VAILLSRQPDGADDTNYGRFSDAKLDTWIDQAQVEMDQAKRKTAIIEALTLTKSAVFYLPLPSAGNSWAMRGNVKVMHLPNNRLELSWTKLK
jgi:peptide/nickel transport system substrate-binding protein